MIRKSIAVSFLLLLCSCVTLPNNVAVTKIQKQNFTSDKVGIVLFSTGAPRSCVTMPTFFSLYDRATDFHYDQALGIPIDASTYASDFADHHGMINALTLPRGDYYLVPWSGNLQYRITKSPAFSFSVTPGKIIYIGELYMPRNCAKITEYRVNNQFDRDVTLAKAKVPSLSDCTIETNLMVPFSYKR